MNKIRKNSLLCIKDCIKDRDNSYITLIDLDYTKWFRFQR